MASEDLKKMSVVELLHCLACRLTGERLMASQVAVLTAVALRPSVSTGAIVNSTGMSHQNVIRILNGLVDGGEVTFIRRNPNHLSYPCLKRLFYITPQGVVIVRRMMEQMGWGERVRFRMEAPWPTECAAVEMLHRLACCLTEERLMASQVAALTAVALRPSVSVGAVVRSTGMGRPNVVRILNYLAEVGDVTFVRSNPRHLSYPCLKRLFYITPQGVGTVRKMLKHAGWGEHARFLLLFLPTEK